MNEIWLLYSCSTSSSLTDKLDVAKHFSLGNDLLFLLFWSEPIALVKCCHREEGEGRGMGGGRGRKGGKIKEEEWERKKNQERGKRREGTVGGERGVVCLPAVACLLFSNSS